MRLSKTQTWGLLFSIAIIGFSMMLFFGSYITKYSNEVSDYYQNQRLASGTFTTSGLLSIPYCLPHIERTPKITFFLTFSSIIFILLFGVLIWISLTLAQKVNFHLLIWNAPFEKNLLNSCIAPGLIGGSIIGFAHYFILRILFGNDYLHALTLPIFSLPDWLIFLTKATFFSLIFILFIASITVWAATRIKGIYRSTAIFIAIIMSSLAINSFYLLALMNNECYTEQLINEALNVLSIMGSCWILCTYTFEAAALATIIATMIIKGLPTLL